MQVTLRDTDAPDIKPGLAVEVSDPQHQTPLVGRVLSVAPVGDPRSHTLEVKISAENPSGTLRPAERAQTSGDDGSFAFGGLPEQRGLLLFAVAIRDGRTWSGRIERTLAGGEVTLTLQDEDPVLGR